MGREQRAKQRWAIPLLIALLVSLWPGQALYAAETLDPPCEGALLYEQNSGKVLFSRNADRPMTPASITKVMTAILVLENEPDLSREFTIPKEALLPEGSNMDLKEGEVLTIEQLLNATLIYSANDGAKALAIAVAGSEEDFVAMMNAKAKEIGAVHTHYLNPNGFTESFDHITTAEDLRIITDYALGLEGFEEIVSTAHYTIPATNKSKKRKYDNTNYLLWDKDEHKIVVDGEERYPYTPGTFGVKTGMMLSSGWCLVAGAERDGMRLIAICLKAEESEERYAATVEMLEWGFANYEMHEYCHAGDPCDTLKIKYASRVEAETQLAEDISLLSEKGAADAQIEMSYEEGLEAPLAAGDKVGSLTVSREGETLASCDIVTKEAVKRGGPWTAYYISDRSAYLCFGILGGLLLLLIALRQAGRRKRRRRRARP